MTENPCIALSRTLVDEETVAICARVVGACLVFPERLRDCDLETADFVDWRHAVVWGAMRNLEARGVHVAADTVETEIDKEGKLIAIGGVAFLGDLALSFPTVESWEANVAEVRDRSLRRRVALNADDVIQRALDRSCSGEELLDFATARLGALDAQRSSQSVDAIEIAPLIASRYEALQRVADEQAAGGAALTGAPTGIEALDKKIGGWRFKIANMIAARPGMGKSAFGISTADACTLVGMGTHVFSLEDSRETYGDRVLSRASGVPAVRLRQAELQRGEGGALVSAIQRHEKRPWIVDDRPNLSAMEIVRAWRRRAEKNNTRVVIVDYLQLVRAPHPRMEKHEALGASLQAMIDAAKIDNVALVVMSQFNRELEKRADKRPQLSDLRGSGEIEELVKLCVALYRGAYYGGGPLRNVDYECECPEQVKRCYHAPTAEDWQRQAQAIVLKGGNGPTGMVLANWDGPTTNIW